VAATSETTTAGPAVFGDYMGSSFVARAAWWPGAMASFNVEVGRVFGRPGGPQDRTQTAKLEIPFGHAFDKRWVSLPKSAVRVHPVGLRSAIEAAYSGRAAFRYPNLASRNRCMVCELLALARRAVDGANNSCDRRRTNSRARPWRRQSCTDDKHVLRISVCSRGAGRSCGTQSA
jgi:hypothetical protein